MRLFVLLLAALALSGCRQVHVRPIELAGPVERPTTFDHSDFTAVLEQHVGTDGLVDYARLAENPTGLDAYLGRLAATDPSLLSDNDRLAFLLNAYNAYTLRLVADHYPIESILDVVSGPFVPSVNSPFSVKFAVIGGQRVSLDTIEHGTIRKDFDEPRIHVALVCAAIACPPLRREAYVGDRLDAQLDEQAQIFFSDEEKNAVDVVAGTAQFSKIFDWFKDDFGGSDADIQRFAAPYFEGEAREALASASLRVRYFKYDWSLNERGADVAP